MMQNLRTPATPAVAAARDFAARGRLALGAFGTALLVSDPELHPRPAAAAVGLAIILATGLLHRRRVAHPWLQLEESFALFAGVLIVTLGPPGLGPLALLWLVSAALGVVGRGGRASSSGRVIVLGVLASPLLLHGPSADSATFVVAGCALLLSVGRVSNETSELLRDTLTGVLSRAALRAEGERLLAAAHVPVAVILLDLDDFGALNKRLGHAAGDDVLRAAAQAAAGTLRRTDTFGRLGGDEFVVVTEGAAGEAVARRVLDAVARAGVEASAGVASAPRDGATFDELLRAADAALRSSKATGKARASVYADVDGRALAAAG